jgi:peptidoglycan/LPS O-acetylase OafA/YrhL
LAVGAVLVDHGGIPGLSGGYVGVDVFFVLSGFLITSLLLRELAEAGRIHVLAFWSRRVRRLLPALAVMVAGVGLGWRLLAPDAVAALRGDSLTALAWISNWRFALQGSDYFSPTQSTSPLQHTWSLGVEEQYYLLWPLIVAAMAALIGARRRGAAASASLHRVVAVVALVGAVASAITAVVLSWTEPTGRVYFGTDTRVQALLIGSLAATLLTRYWPYQHPPSPPPPVSVGPGPP